MDLRAEDKVIVYDNDIKDDRELARYTASYHEGSTPELEYIITTGSYAYVYMESWSSNPGRGFLFSYHAGIIFYELYKKHCRLHFTTKID